jgi:hypothetical protein
VKEGEVNEYSMLDQNNEPDRTSPAMIRNWMAENKIPTVDQQRRKIEAEPMVKVLDHEEYCVKTSR